MPLNIGTKVYRNLQEQVGYNTECIKKLAEAIDGITIEDKLVVIETDSGTFTPEELVILSGPLAFISNGSRVWIKDSETLTEFVYKAIDIKADEIGSTYYNIGGSKIVITRATGVYNTLDDTIIATYNKTQIDSLISQKADKTYVDGQLLLKANLSGADFTGNVTAPSIVQTMTGYSYDSSNKNADLTPIYIGVVRNGNKLTCVWFMSLTATAENYSGAIMGSIKVPGSLNSLLVPFTLSGLTNLLDTRVLPLYYADQAKNNSDLILQKYGGDYGVTLQPRFYASGLTIGRQYLLRYEVTFLLSDNLAA